MKTTIAEAAKRGARLWPMMLLVITVACDGSVGVRGRVLDTAGEAVGGGEVRLGRPGEAVGFDGETDANGCFALGGLVAPGQRDYFLTVSATGYEPVEGTFSSTGEYAVLVHLAPAAAGAASRVERLAEHGSPELDSCSF